ncbi:arylsulfatase [Stieleria varia]|uniref:Arylsulfatase n=1 Tax=Stieleria varia TaxID=2528005 RepID=A0A5C6AGP7_9BACT|nr:arylsulfatase [Stieleria varia]TWT98620.1 Arylsulfatase [Stieleria varia]
MLQKLLSLTALICLLAIQGFSPAEAAEKPNIIYILLDDAGYGDLSCYGQQKFQTPNIDRLAQEGIQFTDHYSGSTVCAPTRCSLMTGLHTGHTYVRGNREVKPEGQAAMPADIVTIPRLLRNAGYKTGAFGKWGLGAPGSPSDPANHFDVFYGYNCQREAHNYYPTHLWSNFERVELDGKTYTAPLIANAATQFIRDNKDVPFFVYLPVTIPHAAMHAPESDVAPFRDQFPEYENKIGKYAGTEFRNPAAAFVAMMTILDNEVGELMTLLQTLDLDDNTIVMLSSDNGPHREGGHDPVLFDSNGPLRGFKRDLTEGGIRAPMIARWPGKIAPGRKTSHASAHWDVLPTVCELAGVKTPNNIDGISFVNTLMGKPDQQPQHDYLYWEFYEQGGKRAVRFGNWKAIQLNLNKNADSPVALYDLSQDIGETNDVASEHPDLVAKAKRFFTDAHTPSEFWSFGTKKQK